MWAPSFLGSYSTITGKIFLILKIRGGESVHFKLFYKPSEDREVLDAQGFLAFESQQYPPTIRFCNKFPFKNLFRSLE